MESQFGVYNIRVDVFFVALVMALLLLLVILSMLYKSMDNKVVATHNDNIAVYMDPRMAKLAKRVRGAKRKKQRAAARLKAKLFVQDETRNFEEDSSDF